jgi:hypothetical protein
MYTTTRPHRTNRRDGATPRPAMTRADAKTSRSATLSDLADALRDAGHIVHTRCATPCNYEPRHIVSTGEHFFERALALSELTASRHAHIRVYRSSESLFLEVTQLMPESFRLAARDRAVQDALDELDHWALTDHLALSVRRGPRNQLRVAVMIAAAPDAPTRRAGGGPSATR